MRSAEENKTPAASAYRASGREVRRAHHAKCGGEKDHRRIQLLDRLRRSNSCIRRERVFGERLDTRLGERRLNAGCRGA